MSSLLNSINRLGTAFGWGFDRQQDDKATNLDNDSDGDSDCKIVAVVKKRPKTGTAASSPPVGIKKDHSMFIRDKSGSTRLPANPFGTSGSEIGQKKRLPVSSADDEERGRKRMRVRKDFASKGVFIDLAGGKPAPPKPTALQKESSYPQWSKMNENERFKTAPNDGSQKQAGRNDNGYTMPKPYEGLTSSTMGSRRQDGPMANGVRGSPSAGRTQLDPPPISNYLNLQPIQIQCALSSPTAAAKPKPSAALSQSSRAIPFLLDMSDDEDDSEAQILKPAARDICRARTRSPGIRRPTAAEKETARLVSRRLRQQAHEHKRGAKLSTNGIESSRTWTSDTIQSDSTSIGRATEQKKVSDTAISSALITKDRQDPSKGNSTAPMTPMGGDSDKVRSAKPTNSKEGETNAQHSAETEQKGNTSFVDSGRPSTFGAGQSTKTTTSPLSTTAQSPRVEQGSQSHEAKKPITSTITSRPNGRLPSSNLDQPISSATPRPVQKDIDKPHSEKPIKQLEKPLALTPAAHVAARYIEQIKRAADVAKLGPVRNIDEGKIADAARRASGVSRKSHVDQKGGNKVRPEIEDRRETTKARKEDDARREAESKQRAHKKRQEEQRQFEQARKAQDANREMAVKQLAEQNKEESALSERKSALAKLQQVTRVAAAEKKASEALKEQEQTRDVTEPHSKSRLAQTIRPTPRSANEAEESVQKQNGDAVQPISARQTGSMANAVTPATTSSDALSSDTLLESSAEQSSFINIPPPVLADVAHASAVRERKIRTTQVNTEQPDHMVSTPMTGEQPRDQGLHQDAARERRTQAMKERNIRMHHAEQEQQDEVAEPVITDCDSYQPLAGKPVSLNSLAGQKTVARLIGETNTTPTPALKGPRIYTEAKIGLTERLGDIFPLDIAMVRRKNGGLTWAEVKNELEQRFGLRRSINSLCRRHKLVRPALESARVDPFLLDQMEAGDTEASKQVNLLVHGSWPLSDTDPKERKRDAHSQFIGDSRLAVEPLDLTGHERVTFSSARGFQSGVAPELTNGNVHSQGPAEYEAPFKLDSDQHSDANETARPNTSGKQLTQKTMQYYLECSHDELLKQYEDEMESEREPSPMTNENYCHFVYRLQRRDLSKEEVHDGDEIDGKPWVACGDVIFDDLDEANAAASDWILRTLPGRYVDFDPRKGYNMDNGSSDDGHVNFHVKWKDGSHAQVRVAQDMRTYQEGVLPRSKVDWYPKTIFFVRKRIVKKTVDDLFAEHETFSTEETNVNSKAYTVLGLANGRAVEEFVAMTFKSKSRNLNIRTMEKRQFECSLLAELNDNEMFYEKHERDGGTEVTEVWVDEGKLEGPRNL